MPTIDPLISSNVVHVKGLKIHYLSAGQGEPVVLLHGWPTSSYLWRKIIPRLAGNKWVIAPDLLGFGGSDKPIDTSYTLNHQVEILDSFLTGLGINQTSLIVHDLGGPVGLM